VQFSMVPLNLMRANQNRPTTSSPAPGQNGPRRSQREGKVNVAWDGKGTNSTACRSRRAKPSDASYLYCCSNETIQGLQFQTEPDTHGAPLVLRCLIDFSPPPALHRKYD